MASLLSRVCWAGNRWYPLAWICVAALLLGAHPLAAAQNAASRKRARVESPDTSKPDHSDEANAPKSNDDSTAGEEGASESAAPEGGGEAAPAVTPSFQDLVEESKRLSDTAKTVEEYGQLIDLCEQLLEQAPSPKYTAYAHKLAAWTANRRGEAIADEGNNDAALADFELAIRHDPKQWKAVHNRGVCLAIQGNVTGAINDFNRTIALNPRFANAFFNRGELHYDQGRYAESIEDYNQALRLSPRDAAAFNSRGHAYYKLGNYPQAIADYGQAIRVDPQNAAAYTNRGDAYADRGQFPLAASDYRAAVRIDPSLGRAYQSAAFLMATCPDSRYRNVDAALAAAKKAIELDGDEDYRYLDTLGAAYANSGDYEQAKELAVKVLEIAPENERPLYQRRLDAYDAGKPYRDALAVPASAGRTRRGNL